MRIILFLLLFISYANATVTVTPPHSDRNGFTVFTPTVGDSGTCSNSSGTYNGTCIVYISSSGNDATCQSQIPPVTASPSTTCLTFTKALSLTRNHAADWILFKGGDTITPPATLQGFSLKGKSVQEPMVIGSYPNIVPITTSDRAIIDFNGGGGLITTQVNSPQYLAIVGLKFYNSGRDPDSVNFSIASLAAGYGTPHSFVSPFEYLLIENNEYSFLTGFSINNAVSPTLLPGRQGLTIIRRNSFQFFYASSNDGSTPSLKRNGNNQVCILGDFGRSTLMEDNFFRGCGTFPRLQTGGTVTISHATPAVVKWSDTGLPPAGIPPEGSMVAFTTTGSLPTGVNVYNTSGCGAAPNCYFICNVSSNTANLSTTKNCASLINTTSDGTGVHTAIWMDPSPDVFSHNIYYDTGWDACSSNCDTIPYLSTGRMIIRNNISSYSSNIGIQARPGGIIFNNLLLRNPFGVTCCSYPSTISYNVILEATGVNYPVTPLAQFGGIEVASYTCGTLSSLSAPCPAALRGAGLPTPGADGTVIQYNILAHRQSGSANREPIRLDAEADTGLNYHAPATANIDVSHNIGCSWTSSSGKPFNDLSGSNTISNNAPAGNSDTDCSSLGYSDSGRTVGGYLDLIENTSGSTTDDFLDAAADKILSENYDPRYMANAVNNYIRDGFDMQHPPISYRFP